MSTAPRNPSAPDAEELLHLALAAMRENRDDDAIAHLKRGIAVAPDDGNLHYLLGSLHAQAGRHERAIDEMSKAVRLAPQLETARFQLGLLQLTSGGVDAAVATWSALDALDAGHPLRLFKTGLLHLVRDEFAECIDALRRGIADNDRHPALNRDMQRVVGKAEAALAANAERGR